MNERDKLVAKARDLAIQKHVEENAWKVQRDDYETRRATLAGELSKRLDQMSAEYRGSVHLSYSHPMPTAPFHVHISNASTAIKKPFASIQIQTESNGFYVTDELKRPERYTIPYSRDKSVEEVAEIIRGVAAEFLVKGHTFTYEFPEWYTVLFTLVAALAGLAAWGLLALLGGVWGILLGWIGMLIVYHIVRAVGPFLGVLGAAVFLGGLLIEALQKH